MGESPRPSRRSAPVRSSFSIAGSVSRIASISTHSRSRPEILVSFAMLSAIEGIAPTMFSVAVLHISDVPVS